MRHTSISNFTANNNDQPNTTMRRPSDSTASSSRLPSKDGESSKEGPLNKIRFSTSDLAAAVMQPTYSKITTITSFQQHLFEESQIFESFRKVSTAPKKAMSDISSEQDSEDGLAHVFPISVPIDASLNAEEESAEFAENLRREIEADLTVSTFPERDLDIYMNVPPTRPWTNIKKSNFYAPERRQPVRIIITKGSHHRNTVPDTRVALLPLKGLRKGLPLGVVKDVERRYGAQGLPPTQNVRWIPEMDNLTGRLDRDMNETMRRDDKEFIEKFIEAQSFVYKRHRGRLEASQRVISRRLGVAGNVSQNLAVYSKYGRPGMESLHLAEVHERLKMRKKV